MGVEENKAIVGRFIDEMLSEENLNVADELFTSDHILEDLNLAEEKRGVEVMQALARLLHTISDDIEFVVHDLVAEGNTVMCSWTARGTAADEFRDDPADMELVVGGFGSFHISDGRISETRHIFRSLEIGTIPEGEPKREEARELLRTALSGLVPDTDYGLGDTWRCLCKGKSCDWHLPDGPLEPG